MAAQADLFQLHPDNPRFFLFRGAPTFLLTSGEHYGAVMNLDFDYLRYLSHLQRHRFNYTRIFIPSFVELQETIPGAGWENPMATLPGRLVTPWRRTTVPGYSYGGTKFDLEQWDPAFFERLHDFIRQASLRGIIVEVCLFSGMYNEAQWSINPMHHNNNVNGVGSVGWRRVFHTDNDGLLPYQERMARKIASELIDHDNVFLEVINEPYLAKSTPEWADRIIDALDDEYDKLGRRHLLAWNVANGSERAEKLHPNISILNFHYANPPDAIQVNHDLAKPVVYDESGFIGIDDEPYRIHAWEFMLSGGSGFNHLDYSYSPAGMEDGSRILPPDAAGGGSEPLRNQLTALRDFLSSLPFASMEPSDDFIFLQLGDEVRVSCIQQPGQAYAAYFVGGTLERLTLKIQAGYYNVRWLDPVTGSTLPGSQLIGVIGTLTLTPPALSEVALAITKHTLIPAAE